jgi:hypothetical protein
MIQVGEAGLQGAHTNIIQYISAATINPEQKCYNSIHYITARVRLQYTSSDVKCSRSSRLTHFSYTLRACSKSEKLACKGCEINSVYRELSAKCWCQPYLVKLLSKQRLL